MVTVKHEVDSGLLAAAIFARACEFDTGLVSGGGNSIVQADDGMSANDGPGRAARGKPV
jgi:hypothetical protein